MTKIQPYVLPDGNIIVSAPQGYALSLMAWEICRFRVYEDIFNVLPSTTVLDVGASIGIFTIHAATQVGTDGLVIAVEPDPQSFDSLAKNLSANNIRNVLAIQRGAWNSFGVLPLTLHPTLIGIGNTFMKSFASSKSICVEVAPLSSILSDYNITYLDFVKIDVEGAEMQVLEGLQEYLPFTNKLAIAAYHKEDNPDRIINFLMQFGFTVIRKKRLFNMLYLHAYKSGQQ